MTRRHDDPQDPQKSGPVYRAYQISDDDRIVSSAVIDAETDDDALREARQRADGLAIELWDRGRLVARIPPQHASR